MESWYSDEDTGGAQALEQERKVRAKELDKTLSALRQLDKTDVVHTFRYFPVRFLTEAAQAYLYVFNNASVFYASLSVEVAILIKLQRANRLPQNRKGLELAPLITLASRTPNPILDEPLVATATNIRKLRNCYVHYYNIMASQVIIQQEYRKHFEETRRHWPLERARLARDMPPPALAELDALLKRLEPYFLSAAQDDTSALRAIPDAPHLVREELQEFIQGQIIGFMKWMLTPEGQDALRLHKGAYGIEDYDARCGVQWATEVITKLGFLV